jgi:hypothetical protein
LAGRKGSAGVHGDSASGDRRSAEDGKMELKQVQIQRQAPESLNDLVLELADLFLDYHLNRPDEIARVMVMLNQYESFYGIAGKIFLDEFLSAIEEDAKQRGYSLEGNT